MTTVETLTVAQCEALEREAGEADDPDMANLAAAARLHLRRGWRDTAAVKLVVEAIRNTEAQS